MDKPAIWEIVLKQFQERKYFQNGLTLPFLIGTHSYFGDNNTKPEISLILEDMISNRKYVSILFCDTIGEYVFSWLDNESIEGLNTNKIMLQCIGSLVNSDGSVKDFVDLESMKIFFEDRYRILVEKQKFSKNQGVWGPYSDGDIKQLESIRSIF